MVAAQVQCEQCGKLVLASGLKHHLAIHSGVKSHLCDLCGRAFLLKSYLNAHIRVNHRGIERPKRYMCSHCGHACYTKDKLEVHERVHTDERVSRPLNRVQNQHLSFYFFSFLFLPAI